MYRRSTVPLITVFGLVFAGLLSACYKKDIQFGNNLAQSHTRIISVDTVTAVMSTYVFDSFPTNNNKFILLGNYNDDYLGNTGISTFFQLGLPTLSGDRASIFPNSAIFDSLVLDLKPSGYYYGDTTKPFNISVYPLAAQPQYTRSSYIYNTNTIEALPDALGSFSKVISPYHRDSIHIKLPHNRGQAIYDMLKTNASEVQNETNWLNYLKGLTIQASGAGAVYGFNFADSTVRMRLHYHLTVPNEQKKVLEFTPTRTSYQFNRIVTDRTGTALEKTFPTQKEFFASATHPYSFVQSGTGALLKIKFPTLRSLLQIGTVVRLLDAKLILKPVNKTFGDLQYLPPLLGIYQTDATNNINSQLADSTGNTAQYRTPFIDFVYGVNTQYTFSLTGYVNALLNTSGTTENGVFIFQDEPTLAKQINRGVFGSRQHPQFQTKLVLNLLTID